MINFIVEQTGFPEDMIDLDADLESDLQIDSIKKGQLFGELSECFDVQPDGTKTFDDFKTLRSILDYIVEALGSAPVEVAPTAQEPTTAPVQSVQSADVPSRDELEKFMINFIVEQTGFPEDMIDLDADLESDLQIDSIKKGQLFGELSECFDVQPDGTKTFDDFKTLRSILDYIVEALGSAPVEVAPTAQEPATAPVQSVQSADVPSRDELEKFMINFIVEQTGFPEDMIDLDADLESDLQIDSIKKGQLFGELSECFDVQPDGTKTFDDFKTLRSILDYIVEALQK